MVDTRVRIVLVCSVLVVTGSIAIASERSEILVAKGELAYNQAKYTEAERLLKQAVAADPDDASAHAALGHVLLAVGRGDEATAAFDRALALDPESSGARAGLAAARGEPSPVSGVARAGGTVGELGRLPSVRDDWDDSRWGFSVTTGFQYDTNVTVEPDGAAGVKGGQQSDVGWVASVGTEFDLVERENFLLRFEYDLYQTLHLDLSDYDFRSQSPRATASYGLTSDLWIGAQGGYNYYTLGDSTYQGEPYVMPFASYLEGEWGLTQVIYRWGEDTFFSKPFNGVRDGPNQTINASQTFYFPADRYVTAGYQWNQENPTQSGRSYVPPFAQNRTETRFKTIGNDWQYSSNQGYLGFGTPTVFGIFADVLYLFRSDNYRWPNSYSGFNKKRQDDANFIYAGLTRQLTEHIALAVTYYGTLNGSNIDIFEYNRNVVATLLQVTY